MKRKQFLRYSLLLTGLASLKTSKLFGFYSATKKFFLNKVKFIWSGAITTNSVKINAKLTSATTAARLVISTDANLTNPLYGVFTVANTANNFIAPLSVTGLAAGTQYYYGIEADGIIDTASDAIGRFKTAKAGPQSFKFSVASCNANGNHPVWLRIKEKNSLLHITHGDFHYGNPNSATNINIHRAPFENVLAQPAMKEFLQNTPIVYTWDDHDYCGDDSNSFYFGRTNARLVFQEYVPHFPLAAGTGDVPIYQAFTVGRVRFIVTDLRSERGAVGTSLMGAAQKAWFKNECLTAKTNNITIVWISSVPWGGNNSDTWAGYGNERIELSDFFKANAIANLLIICGDAHMLGIDNGTNHDFSTGGNNPNKYPVLQAAAVNQVGSYKGGIYSQGYFTNPNEQYGQYAVVEVTDNAGSSIGFSITGYRVTNTGTESVLISYSYNAPVLTPLPIKITGFSVKKSGQGADAKAVLLWETENILNAACKLMIVERSVDGFRFDQLHIIDCRTMAANTVKHSFVDEAPVNGKNYYRIKVTEQNGSFIYSRIESIFFNKELIVKIINNPATDKLLVEINATGTGWTEYVIRDVNARLVLKRKLQLNNGRNNVAVNMQGLSSGVYFFVLTHGKVQVAEKFLVKAL